MSDFFENSEFLRQMECLLSHVDYDQPQCPCDDSGCRFQSIDKCTRTTKGVIRHDLREAIMIYKRYKE